MVKYQDEVFNIHGDVVPGAVVTVYLAGTMSLATLYANSLGSVPLANPVTADYMGYFYFYAASGTYDITISGTGLTTRQYTDVTLGGSSALAGEFTVDGTTYTTIQAAITAAGTTGAVRIPPNYTGTDTYTNSNGIQIIDERRVNSSPSRQRGFINVLVDCGLKGDGTTDDSPAAQTCLSAYPGAWFVFPMTKSSGACSYRFASTVYTHGEGTRISGASSGWKNSNTSQGGTVICPDAGVTAFWSDMTPNSSSGTTFENFSIKGAEGHDHLGSPTKLNIPADLPMFTRSISAAQRTGNVLTVTTTLKGNEGLAQQVGSTVKIVGTSDPTVNGLCTIATLTGLNTFSENASGFTCAQNGADTAALGAGGTVTLPTTGTSTADGIRICANFNTISNVTIAGMGRHAVNADMQNGHGCTTFFSDDLIIEKSNFISNQGSGFYAQGIDSNAGSMFANTLYYNLLWGAEDQSALGNNWFGNQISNNGSQWASVTTPTTKVISSIARVLGTADSTVSVVLASADTNIKVGSCVVIAGVTDSSFNSPVGQCFFVTTLTDSTHYTYIQPGAPVNASSSGGTSRMATFAEAYLSSGIDSGAVKVGTQVQTYSSPWVGNYVEGGQACKFGSQMMAFGGANMPTCATLSTFKPASLSSVTPGIVGSSLQFAGFANEKDANNSIFYKAGMSGGTTRHTFHRWHNNNLTSDSWGLDVDPSGAIGTTGSWRLSRGTAGSGNFRLSFFGATNANGITRISSESTGAVQVNLDANSGTGGFAVASGGASPAIVSTIDSAGKGTFNGGLVINNLAAPTVSANQLGLGSTTATTVGAAGVASALPANPTGYLIINVAGTNFKIPYYAN